MGKRLTASGSFTVATIEDGVSVQAQYAPNSNPTSSQIHTVWQDGDLYMRTRESNDSTWSDWHLVVGESGDETDYKFGISEQKVTDSASIPPSDIDDEDWDDAPMAVTTAKPFLWSRVQKKVWNATSQSYDIESTRYIRLTGEDGTSVIAQYSPDKETVHTVWQAGDLYMRTKTTGGEWSDWHKIVGENGDETDYKFNISDLKTGVNDSTASSHLGGGWEDAPKVVTNTFPYLWTRIVKRVWDETQQKYVDSDPSFSRLTGEKGEAGFDAPSVELSRTNILYDANNDGVSILQQDFHITYSLVVKSVSCTIANVSDIVITLPTNMSIVANTKTKSAVTLRIPKNTSVQGVVTIKMKGTQGGREYTATSTITVDGRKQGEQGEVGARGKTGRFYYYAGEWNDFGNNDAWVVSDAQAPFFGYTPTGNTHGYYVFNPDENGTFTKTQIHDTYGDPSANHAPWVKMWGDFKYIITEAIFGDYAHFGSFIINGDWLLSTQGIINGAPSKRYWDFDPQHPNTAVTSADVSSSSVSLSTTDGSKSVTVYMEKGKTYKIYFQYRYTSGSGTTARRTIYLNIMDPDTTDEEEHIFNPTASNAEASVSYLATSTGQHTLTFSHTKYYYAHSISAIGIDCNFIPNFAADGLTGETYQNVAHVRGEIHATSGEFDGAFMSVDRKVAICGTPITTSSYWRGLAVGINPDEYDPYSEWGSSSDLVTAGARFNSDSSQGYGRIMTTRNGSYNRVLITSAPEGSDGGGRVAIRGCDGSVTCEKMNVSGAASITGSLSVSGSLKTGSGTVSLPSDPNTGTIVFVKGTTGDVTSVSGNGKKIMESNSNTESSTRADLGKNSAFYIFDGTRWIEFFCG